ncbi:MAG: DUF3876 domain-containing protein [Bacteroidales bacterium]|jgi:hypothetical protein|nr:DUF3876 domain-containing protein [Dysgonamonadaceae bacterium]MDD3309848.1 DUF3876 domain-containing protein [Dysgonamonadaceae bacterium]MDD4399935.1 DUF3876 domain-containing protein [Dysgonamonadaceae bacterium]
MKTKNINLDSLVGNWESINLNPTVIIYKNEDCYLLSVIHMNETSKQASPVTYEIQEDEDGFFVCYNLKRTAISYDTKLDLLTISALGDYMRN